jgi:hypothetical protein
LAIMLSLKINFHLLSDPRILLHTCFVSIQGWPLKIRSFLTFQRLDKTLAQTELSKACFLLEIQNLATDS